MPIASNQLADRLGLTREELTRWLGAYERLVRPFPRAGNARVIPLDVVEVFDRAVMVAAQDQLTPEHALGLVLNARRSSGLRELVKALEAGRVEQLLGGLSDARRSLENASKNIRAQQVLEVSQVQRFADRLVQLERSRWIGILVSLIIGLVAGLLGSRMI